MNNYGKYQEIEIKKGKNIRQIFEKYTMFIILIAIWIVFAIMTQGMFLLPRNISNILIELPTIGVLCIGMTFCIITANIDLSVGSVAGFSGAVCALLITQTNLDPLVSMSLTLLLGIAIGLLQGFLIAYQRIPSFIVTLGGLMIFKGAMLLMTNNASILVNNSTFMFIGNSYIPKTVGYILGVAVLIIFIFNHILMQKSRKSNNLSVESLGISTLKYLGVALVLFILIFVLDMFNGLPVSFVILILLAALFTVLLNKTKYGRRIYAVGGNKVASKLAGINVEKTVMLAFVIVGFFAALSGLLVSSRLGAASSTGGNNFEMDAISACVIGGVSLSGGRGKITNALIGALVMVSLTNGMSLLGLELHMQNILKALILILAVLFDVSIRSSRE